MGIDDKVDNKSEELAGKAKEGLTIRVPTSEYVDTSRACECQERIGQLDM